MDYQYTKFRLPPEDIANSQYVSEFGDVFGVNEVSQEYHELGTVLSDGGDIYGVSSVVFDKNEELFWTGNQGGHVTSYYGPSMQKYTSFQVHTSEEVRSLLTIDEGILALTKTTLRHQIRRGIPKFTHKSANMIDMQCLMALESNRIVMGGHQNKLIEFDLTRLEETKQHSLGSLEARCAILRRHSYLLVAGDPSGRITLRDPISLRSQHVLDTHSASLSDFDVQGNLIITCGFSNNQGALACDCFLLVYDVRALRPLPPLPVCCEPLLLRFMPAVSSRLAVVTAHGQVQLVDTIHGSQPRLTMFQVNTQNCECLSFDISSTSQAFGFGDQSGHLHLFSPELNTEPAYNNFSRATEFADTPEEFPFVNYTDENFLPSTIPLPPLAAGTKWLSDWSEEFTQSAYRMPRPIDMEVMRTIKMQGPIGYAPNPHTFRRNQIPYVFEQPSSPSHGKSADNSYNSSSVEGEGSAFVAIPKRYRKVEVRYSKSGTNEFDFEHYNKTGFPGLEATLPNSYCNAMLQVLYYIFPVKRALYRHTCTKEFCLSCELGFLFRMLDTKSGAPCQASNFLRAFRTVPEASALGLILSDRNPEAKMKTNLGSLIQSWNRFILHQMHYEILETRKREMEDESTHILTDRLSAANLSTPYDNHTQEDPYRNEDFIYQPEDRAKEFFNSTPIDFIVDANNSEGYQLKTPAWRKRREAEERDRISLLMVQDEGKYLWLSPTALDNSEDVCYYEQEPKLSLDSRLAGVEFASIGYRGAGDSNVGDINDSQIFDGFSDGSTNNDEHTKKQNHDETEISRLFGTKQLQVHKCLKCNREEHKESIVLLCNLQYPNKTPIEPVNFTDVLKSSLCPRKTTPAWCERCSKFSPTLQCCSVTQLPHLLAVNCGLTLPADKEFWQKQMDFTVSAALGHPVSYENSSGGSSTAPLSNRPCRYGMNCSRPGCRFKHPDDVSRNRVQASPSPTQNPSSNSNSPAPSTSAPTALHHLYGQYPWLPHDIVARLSSSGQLTIDKTDTNGLNSKGDISNQYTKSKSSSPPSENGSMSSEYSENNHNSHDWKVQETRRHYSLSAVVCYVDDIQKNIVSLIKMNGDEIPNRVPQNGQPQWYLFNDFCVLPVSASEVCWFNLEWKSPCVLFYRSVMAASHWSSTPSAPSFLGRRLSAGRVFGNDNHSIAPTANFTPLTPHEFPKRGEIVGMDAEFVTLNQEEAELRSDGRLSTIRPSHLAVARITCVRGQGPLEGTPFIDDYISTQEQVVDYLTKFSGINPGDLDANFSSKHLTTLKSTYQKLRCLVDTGVLFVGHGLNNDFRVINLVVPPEQIIDTVQLFHLPHHRMVSLKFLAWHLLDIKIQSETHDSTEDARTALQLYRRYMELEAEGSVNRVLATLYETGKIMQWKVPED